MSDSWGKVFSYLIWGIINGGKIRIWWTKECPRVNRTFIRPVKKKTIELDMFFLGNSTNRGKEKSARKNVHILIANIRKKFGD
jgi:hypothetical protein